MIDTRSHLLRLQYILLILAVRQSANTIPSQRGLLDPTKSFLLDHQECLIHSFVTEQRAHVMLSTSVL